MSSKHKRIILNSQGSDRSFTILCLLYKRHNLLYGLKISHKKRARDIAAREAAIIWRLTGDIEDC